jgi:hypothetical protein
MTLASSALAEASEVTPKLVAAIALHASEVETNKRVAASKSKLDELLFFERKG